MRVLAIAIALALAGCFGGPMDRLCTNTFPGGSVTFPWDRDLSKLRETLTANGWIVNSTPEEPLAPLDFTTLQIAKQNVTGFGGQISGGADPLKYRLGFPAPPDAHTKEDAERALTSTLHELQARFGGNIAYTGEGTECH